MNGVHAALPYEPADFDAAAALLASFRLDPTVIPLLPMSISAPLSAFLEVYGSGLPIRRMQDWADLNLSTVTLLGRDDMPALPEDRQEPHIVRIARQTGALSTRLVEKLIGEQRSISAFDATVIALGIYDATGWFTHATTHARDLQAAGWLLAQGAVVDTITRYSSVSDLSRPRQRTTLRVTDIMSRHPRTVDSDARIGDIIGRLRRIGHEGYPVIEHGQVVGLLTRRDADRASEHGLHDIRVRNIMHAGNVTLRPDDTFERFEKLIAESGWGQIPVVDDEGHPIGIVTRTDLLKHWSELYPPQPDANVHINRSQIESVLGKDIGQLIEGVASTAAELDITVYMVGGCVRDLLLQRRNDDVDFVAEGDAIRFARATADRFGGKVTAFPPFGTAKWVLDSTAANTLSAASLPDHVDFASARNEFYEQPTALPIVYNSSIKMDLQRRDFTINTLAVQIAPQYGRVLDFYGGLSDLRSGKLRVLHSLSFIDDPTRILRAARFQHRLGFALEARTASLIEPALPMLERITGERIRNEIDLIFREEQPETILRTLAEWGVLTAIHPAFTYDNESYAIIQHLLGPSEAGRQRAASGESGWLALAATWGPETVMLLCERLLIAGALRDRMNQTADLRAREALLMEAHSPSFYVSLLDAYDAAAIETVQAVTHEPHVRQVLERYLTAWRHVQPMTTGHTLITLGLKPGPCFKRILDRLRAGLVDGAIIPEQEQATVREWIAQGFCDD